MGLGEDSRWMRVGREQVEEEVILEWVILKGPWILEMAEEEEAASLQF